MIMLNLLANDTRFLLLEKQNQRFLKNEKLKDVILKIHEISSREFQKSIGLRDFSALTMDHLEMVT